MSRRWSAALVMIAGLLMDLIEASIVNVALPTIRADLRASGAVWSGWPRRTCWRSPRH